MTPQDNVARQVREQLGSLMIEMLVLKTEIELRDVKIKELQAEIEKLSPKKKAAKPSETPPEPVASTDPAAST